ncbi:hypothetical protein [Clostridium sardiniense]|uniref:hypothetical protein n=1 Tax=Clostridium sardiniense TaxID=29369 RepID=UPI00195D8721|nr:hypothetical protein [Clostridium sardiniense]MBM7836345.1 hypothetical protein [Clostridium sardiniense]
MDFKNFSFSNKKTTGISVIRILIAFLLMFYAISYKSYAIGVVSVIISGLSISIREN